MRLPAIAALALALLPACSTYKDELARGQHAFEQNQHERALALFRGLEPDTSHLTSEERVHYAYLRGMTDYRIGYKDDARHWLALAKALEEKSPGLLPGDWKGRLDEALTELDNQVHTGGIQSLSNAKRRIDVEPRSDKPKASEPSAEDEDDDVPKAKPQKRKPAPSDESE
jgi:hypothetical protein